MYPTTHQNEFIGTHGSFHMISPVGYGQVVKNVLRGAHVRSAKEQFEIHSTAAQFTSAKLRIPRPLELVHCYAYAMEQIYDAVLVHPLLLKHYIDLLPELNRFYKHMEHNGYFPYNYSLFIHPDRTFSLLDFSCFGTLSLGYVRFKHLREPIPILLAETTYGFTSLLFADYEFDTGDQEKIECSAELL
jgi:hypothetical protein